MLIAGRPPPHSLARSLARSQRPVPLFFGPRHPQAGIAAETVPEKEHKPVRVELVHGRVDQRLGSPCARRDILPTENFDGDALLPTKGADGGVVLSEAAHSFTFGVAVAGRCNADAQLSNGSRHEPRAW